MQTYETVFIATPTLAEDEERSIVETLAQIVTDGGGTFFANDRMGRRRLAYPIRKQEDGVYVRFLYDAEQEVPRELERRARLNDRVLRAMTVKLHEEWATGAKEQAVIDAQRRAEAAAAAEAAALAEEEAAAKAEAEKAEAAAAEAAAAEGTDDAPAPDGDGDATAAEPAAAEPAADDTATDSGSGS